MRVALVVAVVLGVACKKTPEAGDTCGQFLSAQCKDDHTELECEDGHYIEVPCRGAKGCDINNDLIRCDVSDNQNGDRCARPDKIGSSRLMIGGDEGTGECSSDRKAIVLCHDGSYVRYPCDCRQYGDSASCHPAD